MDSARLAGLLAPNGTASPKGTLLWPCLHIRIRYSQHTDRTKLTFLEGPWYFSQNIITHIDHLVGDKRFSAAMQHLLQTKQTTEHQTSSILSTSQSCHPFPPNDVINVCLRDFFQNLNNDLRFLFEPKVRAAVNAYLYGQRSNESGWELALNVIIMHTLRKGDWELGIQEHRPFLSNALLLIPHAILQTPNAMTIGSLLLLVTHFMFSAEDVVSTSVLALAVQLTIQAGYHHRDPPGNGGLSDTEVLHNHRLFWLAYMLDRDLAFRTGKPALIPDAILVDLPEEFPPDWYGVHIFPGNVLINTLYIQLRLSHIQGIICSKLYLRNAAVASASSLPDNIAKLDAGLRKWQEKIPEPILPNASANFSDSDVNKWSSLLRLHFLCLQMDVAIQSAAVLSPLLNDNDGTSSRSIAPCVNSARAAIALLRPPHLRKAPIV
ncbi:fungal specific transcription factor [Colletotrichum scovillei]|uniref:fungal specific transcription factor n=1 Tax=Colletotrichum scovillei TaxID=1209932 RepID=UPI0015C3087A|nr:fungal specific transcription factor [Colletotrichum scovillei]KAF4782771.1 fungal specific transcription factor [Colletotrichum scovillei]